MIYSWTVEVFERCLSARRRGHHALLLAGAAGVGTGGLARALARSVLCEQPTADGASCGRCAACGWFDAGNHPDFRAIAPASAGERDDAPTDVTASRDATESSGSQTARASRSSKASREIRIDQVRQLDEFLELTAHRAGGRVVLVEPADAMNAIAANGLLKRLEEPPPGVCFILVASREALLAPTIRSRCIVFRLPLPSTAQALAWLTEEGGLSPVDARRWLALAGGAPLDALRLSTEQDGGMIDRVIEGFAGLPETGIVMAADSMGDIEPSSWSVIAQTWVTDLIRTKAGSSPARHPDRAQQLQRLVRGASLERLCELEARLRELPRRAAHPLNARLLLEDVLLDYQQSLG